MVVFSIHVLSFHNFSTVTPSILLVPIATTLNHTYPFDVVLFWTPLSLHVPHTRKYYKNDAFTISFFCTMITILHYIMIIKLFILIYIVILLK